MAAAIGLAFATPAHAHRALLIGVGSYPGLDPSLRLAAPEEDVERVADALEEAGLARADLTLLTARRGAPPTRAAVLAALDRLAETAVSGERLLVYFSGHGTQAPTAAPALEPDGLDEFYLMHDARGWDGGQGAVRGAIGDRELARAIERIRAKGAHVWFVADACHAGGLFRSGAPDVRVKAVPPSALKPPQAVGPESAVTLPANAGRFAAFYAAAPGAFAIERRLPPGRPDAVPLSQFSFALVRALAAGRTRSLRDLASAIAAADAGLGGDAPEPRFEGDLDMPVLDLAARPRSFAVTHSGGRWQVQAGLEEGLAPGDLMRLEDGSEVRVGDVRLGVSDIEADLPPGVHTATLAIPSRGGARALIDALAVLPEAPLSVEARLWRPGEDKPCARLPGGPRWPDAARSVAADRLPELGQCDVLMMTVTNAGEAALDLSPLHIDAAGKVIALGFVDGESVRMQPGDTRRVALRALARDREGRPLATGIERLALVALPATGRIPRDLRGAVSGAWRSGEALEPGAGVRTYRWRVSDRPRR